MDEFLETHPVFTADDLDMHRIGPGAVGERANEALLAYNVNAGRVLRVKRGLYASVPRGIRGRDFRPDPYLLTSYMAPDAVIAYDTALRFHGYLATPLKRARFITAHQVRKTEFQGVEYVPVRNPVPESAAGIQRVEYGGMVVAVTSPERTVVDLLDKPALGGGVQATWRTLSALPMLDVIAAVDYALATGSRTIAAKTGYYLDCQRKKSGVSETTLVRLRTHIPKQPHYVFGARSTASHLVADWNIIVPNFMEHSVAHERPHSEAHELQHRGEAFWESPRLEELSARQGVGEPIAVWGLYGLWPGEADDGFEDEIVALRKQSAS